MLEAAVSPRVMLALSKLGTTVFRQNVGQAWVGSKVTKTRDGGAFIANARPVQMGLTTGSSDLIGWTPVVVTQEMVGQKVAVFTAVEVKRSEGGRTSKDQAHFIDVVTKAGGIAGVANSPEAAVRVVMAWVTGLVARLANR